MAFTRIYDTLQLDSGGNVRARGPIVWEHNPPPPAPADAAEFPNGAEELVRIRVKIEQDSEDGDDEDEPGLKSPNDVEWDLLVHGSFAPGQAKAWYRARFKYSSGDEEDTYWEKDIILF